LLSTRGSWRGASSTASGGTISSCCRKPRRFGLERRGHDLAVAQLEQRHAGVGQRLAGGREHAERGLVRPCPAPADGDLVALGDDVVHRVVDVGERGLQPHHGALERLRPLLPLRADVVGRHQAVQHFHLALVETRFEQLLDGLLVLFRHGGAPIVGG
jgi:hypothetical protein